MGSKKMISLAFFLGYLVPGLGHWYLGKRLKAVCFFFAIVPCYVVGGLIGGGLYWYEFNFLTLLGYVVKFCNGIPFLIHMLLVREIDNTATYYEAGTSFMLVAGALNLLILIYLIDECSDKKDGNSSC